ALAVKNDPGGEGTRLDAQVRPLLRRPQVGNRGAAPAPAMGGRAVVAGAFLRRAVKVVVARNAERARRRDEGVAQLVALQVGDLELALGLLEVGQEGSEI